MKLKRRNFFLEIILGIIVIYISVLVILFIFQRNLMYHPDENNYFGDKLEVKIEKVQIVFQKSPNEKSHLSCSNYQKFYSLKILKDHHLLDQ